MPLEPQVMKMAMATYIHTHMHGKESKEDDVELNEEGR